MRTTLNLDDDLVTRAKLFAVRRKTTLTAVIEEALARALAELDETTTFDLPTSGMERVAPPDFPWSSGGAMLEYLEDAGAPS